MGGQIKIIHDWPGTINLDTVFYADDTLHQARPRKVTYENKLKPSNKCSRTYLKTQTFPGSGKAVQYLKNAIVLSDL